MEILINRRRSKLLKIGNKYLCKACSKIYASRSGLQKHCLSCRRFKNAPTEFKFALAELSAFLKSLNDFFDSKMDIGKEKMEDFNRLASKVAKLAEQTSIDLLNQSH